MTRRSKPRSDEPASKMRLRLWIRLLRTSRAIEAEIRERLRTGYGVTLPQFDVMAALARADDGMSMSQISRFLMVSNGNVTGIVDRLVIDGLVAREQGRDDRRKSFIHLTGKGRAVFDEIAAANEGWIDTLFGDVGGDEARTFLADLERMVPMPRRAAG